MAKQTATSQPTTAMQPEEFASLRAQVEAIRQRDVQLGALLYDFLGHVGHLHGLDMAEEDAKAAEAAKAAEEAALQATAPAAEAPVVEAPPVAPEEEQTHAN